MRHIRALFALVGLFGVGYAMFGVITFSLTPVMVGCVVAGLCLIMAASMQNDNDDVLHEARRRIRREDAKKAAQKFEDDVLKEIARMRASDKG